MKVIKPLKLGVMHRMFELRQRQHLAVAIYAYFSFDRPQRLLPEISMWKAATEALAPGEVLDEGMPKPEPEVTIHGSCYPLSRRGVIGCQVRFAMGLPNRPWPLDKKLYVVGDRHWRRGVASAPAPFSEMPIDWAHAFGGETLAHNPGGKGIDPVAGPDGQPLYPLPNVEDPHNLIRSQDDRPAPAGWSALDLAVPSRTAFAGTYDARWQQMQMPGFPEDFDAHYFQTAPADQWLKTLTGRERFIFENMHPQQAVLEGALPRLLPRCFFTRDSAEPLEIPHKDGAPDPDARPVRPLEELPMRAETLRLFPNAARGVIIYRGVAEVREDDAADICELMIATDDINAKRPLSHFQTVLAQRLDKERGAIHSLRERDLLPPSAFDGDALDDETFSDIEHKRATEDLLAANMRRKAALQIDTLRAQLTAQGLDPERHPLPELPPEPEPPPPMEDMADFILEKMDEADTHRAEAEQKKEEALAEARKQLAAQGKDLDAMMADAQASGGGPPTFRAKDELAKLRDQLTLSQNAGTPLPAVQAQLSDPALFEKLQQTQEQILGAYRRYAQLFAPPAEKPQQEAHRLRQMVVEAVAAQRSLADVDLTGADLRGLSLRGANLSRAFLEKADLRGADLAGANLNETVLARADLSDANLHGAIATATNFGGAKLHGTKLTGGLDATRAVFSKAQLHGADLSGADISEADMLEATLVECKLDRVVAKGVLFLMTTLRALSLRGATFDKCIFLQVDIDGADLSGARMNEATFIESSGADASFRGAQLSNIRLVHRCRFPRADFRGASLDKANFRGTDLQGADFSEAFLEGADLSSCNLQRASLHRARAPGSMWIRADLRDANLFQLSAVMAFMSKARLEGANLGEACLVRADLARIVTDKRTSFSGADLTQARLIRQSPTT